MWVNRIEAYDDYLLFPTDVLNVCKGVTSSIYDIVLHQ